MTTSTSDSATVAGGVDGEADAVEGDRALLGDEARQGRRILEGETERGAFRDPRGERADVVDVPGDEVAAEARAQGEAPLEVDPGADGEGAESNTLKSE